MNYLIFDTEQIYNYGYIVIKDTGEIILRQNLVLTNNFENRKLIGENTYKRKMPIYQKDPNTKFVNSAEGANIIAKTLRTYNIDYIIAHNASEDKRQLALLHEQTGIDFPEIPFYDSINLVKILFPNNTQTNLEAIISDISNFEVKQTHTALADCEMLLRLISPIINHLSYFIKYHDIFAHDSDYEVTYKFFINFNKINKFPENVKWIHQLIGMDDSTGERKKTGNFIKKIEKEYKIWTTEECIEYSAKTAKPLKTPGLAMNCEGKGLEEAKYISYLFTNLEKLASIVVESCVNSQAKQETDEAVIERLNAYKEQYERKIYELEEKYNERERKLKEGFANALLNKLPNIIKGGIFNKDFKEVHKLVSANDGVALYNYFMSNE